MEELILDKDNDIDEEMFEEIEDEWNITFKKEKVFWQNILIPNIVYIAAKCPYCKLETIPIVEKKKKI